MGGGGTADRQGGDLISLQFSFRKGSRLNKDLQKCEMNPVML
jgi:hypothetical protein